MLALFRVDTRIMCAVIVVNEKSVVAYGARQLFAGDIVSAIVHEAITAKEITASYGESSTFEIPFGTAIYPLPAGTVLPWEK